MVRYVYDAWGNHAVLDMYGNYITSSGSIGNVNPFRYRGYYYDTETGLYFLQTRYYDPETGRFISQDSIEYAEPEVINGLNLYAYCGNNPVMGYDPNGTFGLLIALLLTIGACVIAGTAVGGISAAINNESILDGMWKGALIGLMVGGSIALMVTGVGTAIAGTVWGSIAVGAGAGSLFALGINVNAQLQNGGFGSLNMKQVASAWGVGLGVGAFAGGVGFGLNAIGAFYGEMLGLTLSGKTFLGISIAKVISASFLTEIGALLGGALGGFIGGTIINNIATEAGLQNENTPLWFATLLKLLFGRK